MCDIVPEYLAMTTPLHEQTCVPCEHGGLSLAREEARARIADLPGWALADDAKSISRAFVFKNFSEALRFINILGALAETEGHHPDIHWWWNTVKLDLSTHAVGGLSGNDFILAAKINRLDEKNDHD